MRGGMRLDTVSKKRDFLRKALTEHREKLGNRITEELQYSDDPAANQTLLTEIADIADGEQMEKWRGMLAQLSAKAERFEFWLKYADAQKAATLLLATDIPFKVVSTSANPRLNQLTVEAPAESRFAIRQWVAQIEQDDYSDGRPATAGSASIPAGISGNHDSPIADDLTSTSGWGKSPERRRDTEYGANAEGVLVSDEIATRQGVRDIFLLRF